MENFTYVITGVSTSATGHDTPDKSLLQACSPAVLILADWRRLVSDIRRGARRFVRHVRLVYLHGRHRPLHRNHLAIPLQTNDVEAQYGHHRDYVMAVRVRLVRLLIL